MPNHATFNAVLTTGRVRGIVDIPEHVGAKLERKELRFVAAVNNIPTVIDCTVYPAAITIFAHPSTASRLLKATPEDRDQWLRELLPKINETIARYM